MKVFLGGSKSISDKAIFERMDRFSPLFQKGDEILVGDCHGTDSAIQKYLFEHACQNVTVYVSGDHTRCNIGGWKEVHVGVDPVEDGIDLNRQKDIQMELDCDRAAMFWDGISYGTRQNIIELTALGKEVRVNGAAGEISVTPSFVLSKAPEGPLKLWLDDIRPAPEGYLHARSVIEAELYIRTAEETGVPIEVIDCDHDLGLYAPLGGDGIKLLDFLAERETFCPIALHTMNPVGRDNMRRMIERYWKTD